VSTTGYVPGSAPGQAPQQPPASCKKSGNLRHAFTRTEGEYLIILNAE
jgi:hypothetical protein